MAKLLPPFNDGILLLYQYVLSIHNAVTQEYGHMCSSNVSWLLFTLALLSLPYKCKNKYETHAHKFYGVSNNRFAVPSDILLNNYYSPTDNFHTKMQADILGKTEWRHRCV